MKTWFKVFAKTFICLILGAVGLRIIVALVLIGEMILRFNVWAFVAYCSLLIAVFWATIDHFIMNNKDKWSRDGYDGM